MKNRAGVCRARAYEGTFTGIFCNTNVGKQQPGFTAIHNGEDAGQEVPHVHVHLVPRSKNDSAGTIHSMFDSSLTLSKDEVEELYNKLKI